MLRLVLEVRRPKVVVSVALIALLTSVVVPGPVGSRVPSPDATVDPGLFRQVDDAALVRGTAMTIQPQDQGVRSAGNLVQASTLVEPALRTEPPQAPARAAQRAATAVTLKAHPWHTDTDISWFGPGFYGGRTACGQKMTSSLLGVAHRSLPCGTLVTFRNPDNGRVVTVPVVDRGPFVSGRTWDLTGGACVKLGHCYTGTINWKLAAGS
jgi:rare lipoprotein A (peptidoglycan hydrolase)